MDSRRAIIMGGGPAGLTAAFELLTRASITPVVLEQDAIVGGISRTVNYKGNRIDIGGHRFFSKSGRVMSWWLNQMPLTTDEAEEPGPGMLLRRRRSRIYYMRRFFDYPITLSPQTVRQLGIRRTISIGASYLSSLVLPLPAEDTLEQFFINRFGRQLYLTFFKSYTEKVWGEPCASISAEWGAQRIKGLSISKALAHAAGKLLRIGRPAGIDQKNAETSLIEEFLYPKWGPGQMWELVGRKVVALGGSLLTRMRIDRIVWEDRAIRAVETVNLSTGERKRWEGDYFFSTIPIRDLICAMGPGVPASVRDVSEGLIYRDFVTVGLLARGLKIHEGDGRSAGLIRDNWIYIQEPDVLLGRLQIFNNWSPHMVADPATVWLGLEYFCYEGDFLWNKTDGEMIALATEELSRIGIIDSAEVLDATVIRMKKTYPAYFGSYARFDEIRQFVDSIANLYLVGRNGMHRYNNQDHSMLTAMVAVDNIVAGIADKSNIWAVNTEQEYHENNGGRPDPSRRP